MTLPVQRLSADVSAAPQLEPQAMAEAAAMGFRSVICNRPDHEGGPSQPTSASIEAAAQAAGLAYAYQPVSSAYQSDEDIARFGELMRTMEKPILVFCRSGARSTRMWQAATAR